MADSLLEKATSSLGKGKETVIASAKTAKANVAETVIASAETAKTKVAETAPKPDVMKDAVDNVVTRGLDGAKSLLHGLEEKKDEVSSSIVGAVSHFTGIGSADSAAATTANRDLPVSSTDNQPLLTAGDRGVETATPWWKNCCGVVDLLKTSSSSSAR